MSGIFDMLSGLSGGASAGANGTSILLQAVGAAMRGESPQAFMKRLANQHPQLKKMNLDDLQGTAQQLAQQNNVNIEEVTKQLDGVIGPVVNK
jgi:hypothetical protein